MNVCFETFGCRLNRAETLEDEARCLARGHRVVTSHDQADVIIVRGCSVTGRAQHDCEKAVERLREHHPGTRVILTGCMPNARRFDISAFSRRRGDVDAPPPETPVPTSTARAYLKVQDGCSCGCTFCIVPRFRGEPRSTPFQDVLDRAKRFIDAGYREIVVTGCNLVLYSSEGRRLADLAAAVAALSPECRVRLGSVEPGEQAREVVRAMAETPNICRSLHLSVQSGSDRILSAMRRRHSARDVDAIAAEAVQSMPLVALGCDVIAGFPGEGELDFQLTRSLLLRHPFSNVHAFPYSERPGTLAAELRGEVKRETRKARAHALADIGDETRRRFAKRFVGRTVDVVVESNGAPEGWTSEYLWLKERREKGGVMLGARSMRRQAKSFVVRSAHGGVLYGELAEDGR